MTVQDKKTPRSGGSISGKADQFPSSAASGTENREAGNGCVRRSWTPGTARPEPGPRERADGWMARRIDIKKSAAASRRRTSGPSCWKNRIAAPPVITERPSTGLERPLPANFLHGVTPRSSRLLIGAQIVQQHTTAIQSTAALHDCAGVEAAQVASCGLLCLSGASFRPTASGPASGSTRAPAAPPTGPPRNPLVGPAAQPVASRPRAPEPPPQSEPPGDW